jgi:hypothetical protein
MVAPEFTRLFTAKEANALLPTLEPLVNQMTGASARLQRVGPGLEQALSKATWAGGTHIPLKAADALDSLGEAMRAIERHGVLVKDGGRGLLDFPSRRDGQLIMLCWQFGEPEVMYWHDLESGFAGRRPIGRDWRD